MEFYCVVILGHCGSGVYEIGKNVGIAFTDGKKAIHGVYNIRCFQFFSIMEFNAFFQIEGINKSIIADFPTVSNSSSYAFFGI